MNVNFWGGVPEPPIPRRLVIFCLGFFFSIRPTDPTSRNAFDAKQKNGGMAYTTTRCRARMLSLVISIPFIALPSTHSALQLKPSQSPLLPCRRNVSFPANSYPLKRRNFHFLSFTDSVNRGQRHEIRG